MLVAPQPKAAVPEWQTVLGGRFLFAPIDRPMMRRARRAALKAIGRDEHGPEPEEVDPVTALEDIGDALSHALILAGVRDWDPTTVASKRLDADGEPVIGDDGKEIFDALPFSVEGLERLLSDPVIFDAFDSAYVVPFAQRERAKNGSAASPSGIGVAATQESNTASSAATQSSEAGAPIAPIEPKAPKVRKPKASGKS